MTTVVINDEAMNAAIGEDLLAIARRNVAHIGFLCDGRGACPTCQCRVLSGEQYLSPPNNFEYSWLSGAQIYDGRRLACQVILQSDGPVSVITGAEETRRLFFNVFFPPMSSNRGESLGRLFNNLGWNTLQYASRFPFNVLNTWPRFVSMPPYLRGVTQYVADVQRLIVRMTGNVTRPAPSAEVIQVPIEEEPRS
ncbi:MAG: (2Fe-2S)-binding protein [Chloroflexales bacterium]|nr:(2Fe-2S)-binding protein [Chloroflexales bacterium]